MTTGQTDKNKHDSDERKHVQVVVRNEDDGDEYKLNAKREETLQTVIDDLYRKKLRRERRGNDRLRCEANGEDVFGFAGTTFDAYLDGGHCPELVWLFSGATGGA